MNLLGLRAVNPDKYALALMDALFDDETMASCCFQTTNRSTKPPLPRHKVKLIQGTAYSVSNLELRTFINVFVFCFVFADCIDEKFGKGTYAANVVTITRKCNQKCLDANKRIKKEKE